MSETAADKQQQPVDPVDDSSSKLLLAQVHEINETKASKKTNSVPYLEKIRQYYDRRMPKSNNSRIPSNRQMTDNRDVEIIPQRPPRGKPETEEDDAGTETVNGPHPGVDDGFFTNNHNNTNDVESIPLVPNKPERTDPPGGQDGKGVERRGEEPVPDDANPQPDGKGGGEDVDEPDIGNPRFPGGRPVYGPQWPNYNPAEKPSNYPGFRTDIEGGIGEPIPDINVYQHKKTLAQGMMDLALFSANANQLRYVLESYERHPYYYPSLILISFSIIFQVAVGIGLIWNANYNVKDEREICLANKINNYTVLGIFLITIINVFVSAFGVANPA